MPGDRLAERIAGERVVAHLATSVDDRPHAAPVWYRYRPEAGVLAIVTGGTKLANVRENPRVCVSMQADEGGQAEWLAVVRGTATVVDDPERIREATLDVYGKYLGEDTETWPAYYRSHLDPDAGLSLLEVDVGSATVE